MSVIYKNGTYYGAGGGGEGADILFDETEAERIVGWYKYSNGTKKPIYEKNYVNTVNSNTDWQSLFSIGNISVCNSFGYAFKNAGEHFPYGLYQKDTSVYEIAIWGGNVYALVWNGAGGSYTLHTTLQYTKNTDIPV